MEDEDVPPAVLQGTEETRKEDSEVEPKGLANGYNGYCPVLECAVEIAAYDAYACKVTVGRTLGPGHVEDGQTYLLMPSLPHSYRGVPSLY